MISHEAYEQIANNQGVYPCDILNGEFFVHQVTKDESPFHAGEYYAIPSLISLPGKRGLYQQRSNGAVVSESSIVSDSDLAERVIVHGHSYVNESKLGEGVIVNRAAVIGAQIAKRTFIGKYSYLSPGVNIGEDSEVGEEVEIGPNVTIGNKVKIGDYLKIGAAAAIGNRAKIPGRVNIAPGQKVRPGKTLPTPETGFIKRKLSRAGDIAYLMHRYMLYNEPTGIVIRKRSCKAIKTQLLENKS